MFQPRLRHPPGAWHIAVISFLLTLPQWAIPDAAALTFGVFAYRPKALIEAQYQPLVEYLNEKVPDANIVLQAMTPPEIETALAQGKLDLVLTDPGHFVLLCGRRHLGGAIATLVSRDNSHAGDQMAGVVLALADRKDIHALTDLKGKRIATPGTSLLGSYQAQAFELAQSGVRLSHDAVLEPLANNDAVVHALLLGRADAGFVRSGIIEAMAASGDLPLDRIKVINRMKLPDFAYAASTRAYPERAIAASPGVDDGLAIQIARALYDIRPESAVAQAADIQGFTVPGDYLPVENLARVLRLPPFEGAPDFTNGDAWARYRVFILSSVLIAGLILLLTLSLMLGRRRLLQSEQRFRAIFEGAQDGIVLADAVSKQVIGMNQRFCAMTGRSDKEMVGMSVTELHPAAAGSRVISQFERQANGELVTAPAMPVLRKDGGVFHADVSVSKLDIDGRPCLAGFFRDVSERLVAAEASRQAGEEIALMSQRMRLLLNSAGEGIYGVDTSGRITFINPTGLELLGLEEHEALGHNAHDLFHSRYPDGKMYPEADCPLSKVLNDGIQREVENEVFIRKNGEPFPVHMVATAMVEKQVLVGAEIVFQDITERKAMEAELTRLATTDPLTGMANRRYFIAQLDREMARIQRNAGPAAVLMLDLDHFKRINDNYGHAAGDAVLQAFARTAQASLRKIDLIGRLGGEEFSILLPQTGLDAARRFAERLRKNIEAMRVEHDGESLQVTVSIGLTELTRADLDCDSVLARVDQALYQAKAEGRNKVEIAEMAFG